MKRKIAFATVLLLVAILSQPMAMARMPDGDAAGPSLTSVREGVSHRLIVELDGPPLAELATAAAPGLDAPNAMARTDDGRLDLDSPVARAHLARLQAEQRTFIDRMRAAVPGSRVSSYLDGGGNRHELTYQVVFNGAAVDPGPNARLDLVADQLRALPGVKHVYYDYSREPSMYASLPLINAADTWNLPEVGGQGSAGEGIKVASMDGGVHKDAPMFDGEGYDYPSGYPLGAVDPDDGNVNGKIIVSRAYFRDWDPPAPGDDTYWPGEAGTSHGVHTASTMAGNAITATWRGLELGLSGVAPRAYVMSYRVFYASINGVGSMYDAEGIAALEDIVRDGADVVNNSWGGGPNSSGGEYDALDRALLNAWRSGVFVSMSNGNAGPALGTMDHPSTDYINVGSTTTTGTFLEEHVDVSAPEPVSESLKLMPIAIASSWGGEIPEGEVSDPYTYVPAVTVDPENYDGCDPWEGSPFEGKAALVSRGRCEFGLKAYNAEQAGATLAIVHNDEARGDALTSMGGGSYGISVTIPALFMGHSNGIGLTEWHELHAEEAALEVNTIAHQVGNTPDQVATSSSRGPAIGDRLKPDIAAPGVNILAQGYGSGAGEQRHLGFGQVSGTSMAAPHVSGAAALLKQAHPDWSNDWVKSALMTTAKYTDVYALGGAPAQPLDMGAGRLDLSRAADPGVILEPPSLSFGRVVTGSQPVIKVAVTSVGNESEQYQLKTVYTGDSFTDTMPVPGLGVNWRSITLEPGETKEIEVSWATSAAMGLGDNQGYFLLEGENHQAHMPAWIRITPAPTDSSVLIIDNDGSSLMSDTLRAVPGAPEAFSDYVGTYTRTLESLEVGYDVYDADAHAGSQSTTIPDAAHLSKYDLIIYETGDYYLPDSRTPGYTAPTRYDASILVEYANGGGRVMAFGQSLAGAFGLPGSSPYFYGFTLAANYVKGSINAGEVMTRGAQVITGLPDTPFADLNLDVSGRGDGAGNQTSIDEILNDEWVPAFFRYAMGGGSANSIVAIGHRDEPTLERPGKTFAGRSAYFSFGLEGVNDDTGYSTREELLGRSMAWLLDEATVSISSTINSANAVSYFEGAVESTYGGDPITYRWDFGDGSPYMDSASTRSQIFGHVYSEPGTYLVRVEATNNLGTTAIGEAEITVGDQMDYIDRWHPVYLPVAKKEVEEPDSGP